MIRAIDTRSARRRGGGFLTAGGYARVHLGGIREVVA